MADSIQRDPQGPDWPLGIILNATPGTPVGIMSLVDTGDVNNPSNSSWSPSTSGVSEYAVRAHEIIFTPCKKGASHGTQNNTGNVYVVRKPAGGAGGRDDYGVIVTVLRPTDAPFRLTAMPNDDNPLNPYRYSLDADNAGDGALVTLIIGG